MASWLLLVNDRISAEDTLSALRAALPLPWGAVVVLATAQRWRPLTAGIPLRYRAERQLALGEIWAEQMADAQAQLAILAAALQDQARAVDTQFSWGDPVSEAHRLARAFDAGMIAFPIPARRGLWNAWPGGIARHLAQDAPCSVLLARAVTHQATVGDRQMAASA